MLYPTLRDYFKQKNTTNKKQIKLTHKNEKSKHKIAPEFRKILIIISNFYLGKFLCEDVKMIYIASIAQPGRAAAL